MQNPVTPEEFGATGDGSDENSAVHSAINEHNTTGRPLLFRKRYGVTHAAGRLITTRSEADIFFEDRAELVALGSIGMNSILRAGADWGPSLNITPREDVPEGSCLLPLTDASGIPVGKILRYQFTAANGIPHGRSGRVIDKQGDDVLLSVPMPVPLEEGTPFAFITVGEPYDNVTITNYRARKGAGYSGPFLSGLTVTHGSNTQVNGLDTAGLSHGNAIVNSVDTVVRNVNSKGDGAADAAFNIFGCDGVTLEAATLHCAGFGVNANHSTRITFDKVRLTRTETATTFARAFKFGDMTDSDARGLFINRWAGVAVWLERRSRRNTFYSPHIAGTRVFPVGYAAWGIGLNNQDNSDNRFICPMVYGTETTNGGKDITVSGTVGGMAPERNMFIGLLPGISTHWGTPVTLV